MSENSAIPALSEIEQAREIVSGVVQVTPMESSRYLSGVLGSELHLKCENLQRTGSYKIRGAYNRMVRLSDEEKARGVVAASAGNHAQGVALAARELGIKATIFMPVGAALPKLQATRDYGAEVVLEGQNLTESLVSAVAFSEKTGAVFIPPFDHHDVIVGQGTLGLEILDQIPDVEAVIVPIGGGGLIAGVASAVKQRAAAEGRQIRVIGVQADGAAPYPLSIEAGEPVEVKMRPTIADGIAVAKPGKLNFPIIRDLVDEIVTVSDDETAHALLVLLERAKLVVEPAGAVTVAAILTGKIRNLGNTVAVLSGGNIDPQVMEKVISLGLAASDRYLRLSIRLPDRPGQLAKISKLVSDADANVIEVSHTRNSRGGLLGEVEIEMSLETRGPEHVQTVLNLLRESGLEPEIE
ncbi:MAG: threonine ammonia-lyase [Cryobacterium sp.]|nr:threonine ammonia-lyase [Cryobacterium sp.]